VSVIDFPVADVKKTRDQSQLYFIIWGWVIKLGFLSLSAIGVVYLQTAGAAVLFSLHQWRNSDRGVVFLQMEMPMGGRPVWLAFAVIFSPICESKIES
jgi:hypothetical protein